MFAILPSKPSTYFFVINLASACFARLDGDQAIERAASDLAGGKALGWFRGRMEFGPRALGNRSIIADARSSSMQTALNLKIKYRESFRPFAPAVLREDRSHELPDIFLADEFGRAWRQLQARDVAWNLEGWWCYITYVH